MNRALWPIRLARGSSAVEHALVVSALRRAAGVVGVRVDALRMIDYRHALAAGHTGPTLAEVMATFGTWRIAREAAAQA